MQVPSGDGAAAGPGGDLLHDPAFEQLIRRRLEGTEWLKNVVIVGSAPSAPRLEEHLGDETIVVALNNAHRAVSRVDFCLYSDDLPAADKPARCAVIGRSSPHYGPAQQRFGGVLHGGGTMAFNAAYWVLANFPFAQLSFFACDMVYEGERSHFYGKGQPDPLRRDVTLQNLEAKSLRLFWMGLEQQVLVLNASAEARSRLRLPRLGSGLPLARLLIEERLEAMGALRERLRPLAERALEQEALAPCDGLRHDYWRLEEDPAVWHHVHTCDELWLALDPELQAFGARLAERLETPLLRATRH
jgi:hypothetical protein